MNLVKRFFVFALMLTTVFSMSAFTLNVEAAGNYPAGSLLALENVEGSAVYYIGSDGMKYVFPDPKTYATWYENFDSVVRVPVSELDMYPDGGAITYRPGTKLITHPNTNNVYAVEPGGMYCLLPSEAVAVALFGANWTSMVQDVIPGFFSSSYSDGNCELSDTLPDGTLVSMDGTYYYIEDGMKRPFASSDAFEANNFNYMYVMEVDDLSAYSDGSSITGEEEALSGYMPSEGSSNNNGNQAVTGSVMVSVNSDTPTGTTVPASASVHVFSFDLKAGSEAAQINSIKLTAEGLGTSTNIDDVTMYIGGKKVGTSKNFNSDREAIFNFSTPIELAANSMKTVEVKATFAAMGYYQLTIASEDDVNANEGSVSGSFPVAGQTFYADSTATTIGTVSIPSNPDTSSVNVDFGEDDVLLASFPLTAANEDVLFDTARFRNGGTNDESIMNNLKLYIDGEEVASGVYSGNYVTFDVGGFYMEKGDTYTVEVRGDIGTAQVGNTIKLYIKDRADFVFQGVDYGYGVQLLDADPGFQAFDTTAEGMTITLQAGEVTIDMDKSATPAMDVKAGTNDFVIATLHITSNGEDAIIDSMADGGTGTTEFKINGTNLDEAGELKNIEMKDVDSGAVYDLSSTYDAANDWYELSVDDEIYLQKGVTKTFEIRADLENSGTPIDNNDTFYAILDSGAMTITGEVSSASLTDITPSSVTGATHTVKDASLDWTTVALTTKKVVPGASGVVVYRANLEAGDVDGVKLTSVKLSTEEVNANLVFSDTNVSALKLYLNGVLLKTRSNSIVEADGANQATITFNSLPTGTMVPAGETYVLEVVADFTSSFTLGTNTFNLELTALGDVTAKSETNNDPVGSGTGLTANTTDNSRAVTLASVGTLKVQLATNDAKADDNVYLLAGNETEADKYLAELIFTTENEDVKVEELRFVNDGNTTANDLQTVVLYDEAGTMLAEKLVTSGGDANFTNLNIVMPADQATSLWLGVKSKALNVDGEPSSTATHGRTAQFHLNPTLGVVAKGVDSSTAITLAADDAAAVLVQGEWSNATTTSKTATLSGAVLTGITNAGSDGTLTGGTNKVVGKYTFVFENGMNRNTANEELKAIFDALTITVAKSSAVVLTNVEAYIDGTATKVAADTLSGLSTSSTSGTATWNAGTLQSLSDGGAVDGAVTLVIEADVVTTADEYLQTSIADLNGTGGDDDFNFIGDGETGGTPFTNMYLDVADVTGMSLSN